jgi:hypothetical protein
MQRLAVWAFMVVLPIISILFDSLVHGTDLVAAALRWFVFWGVGVRLVTAAGRQMAKPEFTAGQIFGISDPRASSLVLEIGFGNLAIGLIALLSPWLRDWAVPAAVAGALFFGLAGIQHIRNGHMNSRERLAMWSDLFMAIMLAACLLGAAIT